LRRDNPEMEGGDVTEQEFQTWARGQCAEVAKRIVEAMPCMQITIQPAGMLASWPQTGEGIMICVSNYRSGKTLGKPAIPPVLQMNVLASLGCPRFCRTNIGGFLWHDHLRPMMRTTLAIRAVVSTRLQRRSQVRNQAKVDGSTRNLLKKLQ
jgi:hypothetical protein